MHTQISQWHKRHRHKKNTSACAHANTHLINTNTHI